MARMTITIDTDSEAIEGRFGESHGVSDILGEVVREMETFDDLGLDHFHGKVLRDSEGNEVGLITVARD